MAQDFDSLTQYELDVEVRKNPPKIQDDLGLASGAGGPYSRIYIGELDRGSIATLCYNTQL